MKYKKQPKQRIMAWMLVSIYAMFWLSWSLHHFFSPEHQHETKVCRHAPHEKQFHSEGYAAVDCSICQIAPTLADLPDLQIPAFSFPRRIPAKKIFGETTCLPVSLFTIFQPRAPPAPLSWTELFKLIFPDLLGIAGRPFVHFAYPWNVRFTVPYRVSWACLYGHSAFQIIVL